MYLSVRPTSYRPLSFLWIALVALTMAGCGSSKVEKSEPERAKQLLAQVLQAWKDGKASDDLKLQKPPIYVADERWYKKTKLLDFKILDEATENGPSIRIPVELKFGDGTPKKVAYLISTTPAFSVSLSDQ